MAKPVVVRLATAIRNFIIRHIKPLADSIRPPEVLTVITFSGSTGTAVGKLAGQVNIKSKLQLTTGMSVVAVPTGPREFYVVGYY